MSNQSTIDKDEIARFSAIAKEWWDADGPFKPLHNMNPIRLRYIRDQLKQHFGQNNDKNKPLSGLNILDIGCGGGLLCEPLTRLGATVTGVDAAEESIAVAKTHANSMGLSIEYIANDAKALIKQGRTFDVIINMEVLEHVADLNAFLGDCRALLKDNGIMLCSTLNRTRESFLKAIVGAEYLLRWVPKGTHDWQKFIDPNDLSDALNAAGFTVTNTQGMDFSAFSGTWSLSDKTSVNYVMTAIAD